MGHVGLQLIILLAFIPGGGDDEPIKAKQLLALHNLERFTGARGQNLKKAEQPPLPAGSEWILAHTDECWVKEGPDLRAGESE